MGQRYLFCTVGEVTGMCREINTHQLNYKPCSEISSFLLLSIHLDNVGITFVLPMLWDPEKQSFGVHSMDYFKRLLHIKFYITEPLKSLFFH